MISGGSPMLVAVKSTQPEANGTYRVVMRSHDGDVLKNFIAESHTADLLARTEELQTLHPGFTALWI
jgi:hypothetical protein